MSKISSKSPKSRSKFKTLSLHCIILSLFCQALALLTPTSVLAASANSFYFDDFTADYYLSRDASGTSHLKVVETFTAIFPNYDQNHGITRIIPYTNQDGQNLTMASDRDLDITIYHNGRLEQPHQINSGDGYFEVYIGDADTYVHGEHTYRLEYEFQNVITSFTSAGVLVNQPTSDTGWQELYWDTNGNDWSQAFNSLTARVHLSPELQSAYQDEASCYVGRYGSNNQSRCLISSISDGIKFQASDLARGENLTFALQFAPNTFAPIPETADYRVVVLLVILAVALFFAFRQLFRLRATTKAKREYYKGLFIKPEYSPIKDLSLAAAAQNYLHRYSLGSSQVATLMELAVTGKIQLIKTEKSGLFGVKHPIWKIRLLTTDLSETQTVVLQILNGQKTPLSTHQEITVKTRSSNSTLIKLGKDYDEKAEAELENKQLFEPQPTKTAKSPLSARHQPTSAVSLAAIAVLWFFFSLFCGALFLDEIPTYRHVIASELIPIYWLANFIVPTIFFWQLCDLQPFFKHTTKGLEASRYLDGLKLYIKMAEADRLKFLHSVPGADVSPEGIVKLYEKLLPYAVLFRLEKTWLAELSKYYELENISAPAWYVGVGAFSARDFTSAMSSLGTSVSHSVSSGSSSSSSGGGGGGFSGGGGGGGGGGGW